jgi:hypothetical protein
VKDADLAPVDLDQAHLALAELVEAADGGCRGGRFAHVALVTYS